MGRAAAINGPEWLCQVANGYFSCMGSDISYIEVMRHITINASSRNSALAAPAVAHARFSIGDVVRHRLFGFRGVVFDVDPVFANSEEWYESIPEDVRPAREQPFYHLLAENADGSYVAYAGQQNLVSDDSDEPVDHPAIAGLFGPYHDGRYDLRPLYRH